MPWWNPFSTDANNGKTGEQLDAERAALDAARRRREADRAEELEREGFNEQAAQTRDAAAAYDLEQRANYEREREALEVSVADEFGAGLDEGAANVRNTVAGTVGLTFKLLPWWVWTLGLVGAVLWLFGPALRVAVNRKLSK